MIGSSSRKARCVCSIFSILRNSDIEHLRGQMQNRRSTTLVQQDTIQGGNIVFPKVAPLLDIEVTAHQPTWRVSLMPADRKPVFTTPFLGCVQCGEIVLWCRLKHHLANVRLCKLGQHGCPPMG